MSYLYVIKNVHISNSDIVI